MKDKKHPHDKIPDSGLNQFEVLQSILRQGPSEEDPDGMYTGKPVNIYEVPVQDNDDL